VLVTVSPNKSILDLFRHAESGTCPDSAPTNRLQLSPHSIRARTILARNGLNEFERDQDLKSDVYDLKSDVQYASICLTSASGSDT
jgi:hypothetical protein